MNVLLCNSSFNVASNGVNVCTYCHFVRHSSEFEIAGNYRNNTKKCVPIRGSQRMNVSDRSNHPTNRLHHSLSIAVFLQSNYVTTAASIHRRIGEFFGILQNLMNPWQKLSVACNPVSLRCLNLCGFKAEANQSKGRSSCLISMIEINFIGKGGFF